MAERRKRTNKSSPNPDNGDQAKETNALFQESDGQLDANSGQINDSDNQQQEKETQMSQTEMFEGLHAQISQLAEAEKKRVLEQNIKKQLKSIIRQQAVTDIIIEKVVSSIHALPPAKITKIKVPTKASHKEEQMVLQLSDIQAGTYISKEATGGLNEYNQEILAKQFKILLKTLTTIYHRHASIAPIKKLNIHMLGDMVEGIDIFAGQAQHVDQDLYDQCFGLGHLINEFLISALQLFETIEVSCIGGNHGRVGRKGENPHFVNWDIILYKHIEASLKNYSRIKFNIPKAWWYLDDIFGYKFLLLHGDDIKAWNGIPYYGIDRADAKWTKLLKSVGKSYDYLELGHFHSPAEMASVDGEKILNGCWPGGSIFALKSLVTSGRPRQNLFGVHPENGKTWSYPIWLDGYKKEKLNNK